jgi:hypothetical protein
VNGEGIRTVTTPYRLLIREGRADLLYAKVVVRFHRLVQIIAQAGRRILARSYYSLPGHAARDPRRRVVTFAEACRNLTGVPRRDEPSNDWYVPVRPPEIIYRRPTLTLDAEQLRVFEAGSEKYQKGRSFVVPEVFLACLHNAIVRAPHLIVISGRNGILRESALSRDDILESSGLYEEVIPPTPDCWPGDYALLGTPWSSFSYYHWMMDALPRLSLIENIKPFCEWPLIVPPGLTSFHYETLQLAGVAGERVKPLQTRACVVDRLLFPETLSASVNPSHQAVDWLRQRFLDDNSSANAMRRFFVSRRDVRGRTLENEADVVAFLESYDFEVICPGELPFRDQVALFRKASVVIGAHGAAMTNMVFAPANATLIELFGDNYINGCFWALANLRGQRHASLICRSQGSLPIKERSHTSHPHDFVVRIDQLQKLLKDLAIV